MDKVSLLSDGLRLAGTLHRPTAAAQSPVPGVVLCHGFGGSSDGAGHPALARGLADAGYVVLRFDFRGCGLSEGEPGRVIFEEEITDLQNAITFLQGQPGVDPARITVIGASMGGAVAIYAAAADERIRACVASGAIGNGERRFRNQYPDEAEWAQFLARLEEAKAYRRATGQSRMLNRFAIVHIPEDLRRGMPPNSRMEFPAETAISMLAFQPETVVDRIAPRPLLLLHPEADAVVPRMESIHLAARAGAPCELHIRPGSNHFASGEPDVLATVRAWLARYLPAAG